MSQVSGNAKPDRMQRKSNFVETRRAASLVSNRVPETSDLTSETCFLLLHPPAFPIRPLVPHTHRFHFVIHVGLMQSLFNLRPIQARTDALRSIRQGKAEGRSFGYVLLELREIYFVVRVGGRVVIHQVVRFVLFGDE